MLDELEGKKKKERNAPTAQLRTIRLAPAFTSFAARSTHQLGFEVSKLPTS